MLIYTDSLFGTSETFVTALVDYISEIEPRVSIVTHRVDGPGHASPRVIVIPKSFRRYTAAWGVNVALRLLLRRELFEFALGKFLRRATIDLIHAQFGQLGYYAFKVLRQSKSQQPRLVVNFYGYDATGLLTDAPIWRSRYRELFSHPNLAVVVEGPVMKTRLATLGCPEDRIHVVPLCLNLAAKDRVTAQAFEGRHEGLTMGFVGRLVEKKGFVFALRNLVLLLKTHPELRVVIVGDGEQRGLIERLIAEHDLQKQVTLKGMLPYDAMLAEVRAMAVLVVPSHTARNGDGEGGAPTIVAEAQILGTPLIASDHADIPFTLSDTSYMFKEGDDRSFVKTVTRYLREGGRAYDAEQARARTLEKYDRRAIQARYRAIYAGLRRG